jgi:hypothetical protein
MLTRAEAVGEDAVAANGGDLVSLVSEFSDSPGCEAETDHLGRAGREDADRRLAPSDKLDTSFVEVVPLRALAWCVVWPEAGRARRRDVRSGRAEVRVKRRRVRDVLLEIKIGVGVGRMRCRRCGW